jgi:hypothetical protein
MREADKPEGNRLAELKKSENGTYRFERLWWLYGFRWNWQKLCTTTWTVDQPVERSLPTHRTTHRIHADIHASSGIQTHDPSYRTGAEGSCLRPRGQCDRHTISNGPKFRKFCDNSVDLMDRILGSSDMLKKKYGMNFSIVNVQCNIHFCSS